MVVAHELGALAPLIDRAVVLRAGRVVHDGPVLPDEYLHDHTHLHPHPQPDVAGAFPRLAEGTINTAQIFL